MTNKTTMPEPVILRTVMPDDYRYGHVYGYTASQMKAYAAAKVREALEEAAKVAMNAPITSDMLDSDSAKAVAFHTSARIRALIPQENKHDNQD